MNSFYLPGTFSLGIFVSNVYLTGIIVSDMMDLSRSQPL